MEDSTGDEETSLIRLIKNVGSFKLLLSSTMDRINFKLHFKQKEVLRLTLISLESKGILNIFDFKKSEKG